MTTAVEDHDTDEDAADDGLFWRILRGTIWGTVDVVKAAYIECRFYGGTWYHKGRLAVRRYRNTWRFPDGADPDPDEIPTRHWSRIRFTCAACGRSWKTPDGLNDHFTKVHGWERPKDPETKAGTPVRNRRPHGKRKVKGAPPRRRPATAAVDKRTIWNQIGVKAMESGFLQAMKNAWVAFGTTSSRKLSQIREDLLGIEQTLGAIAGENVDNYRRRLIHMGFDPAYVQNLTRAKGALEDAARYFSATIAVIEEEMAEDIKAAKARQAGVKPADSILAN